VIYFELIKVCNIELMYKLWCD